MVTRILSSYNIRGILNYNEAKVKSGDAQLMLANRSAVDIEKINIREKLSRFEKLTRLNDRAKRNAMHIMLNFDKDDRLDSEKLITIARTYMDGIGFGDQPYLVYQHYDVSNRHIHIVSTNIKPDGSRIDFHNIGRSISETVRKNIEIEFNLVRADHKKHGIAKDIRYDKIKAVKYGKKPTKQAIYNVIAPVIRSYGFASLAEFNAILVEFNVIADRGKEGTDMFERRGLVYSVLNENGQRIGTPIKASLFAGRPTLGYLEKKFAANKIKKQIHKQSLKIKIDSAFQNEKVMDFKSFRSAMQNVEVNIVFRRSQAGQLYGLTFVDHQNKTVFNGSDLGKAYSAKAISEKFASKEASVSMSINNMASKDSQTRKSPERVTDNINVENNGKTGLLETLLQKDEGTEPVLKVKRKKKKKHQRSQSI